MTVSPQNVLLYSPLAQNLLGGMTIWTHTYLSVCEHHGLHATLVNSAAEGTRAENPEAKMSIRDEISRTLHIFSALRRALKSKIDVAHVNTSCGPLGIIRDCIAVKIIKKKGVKIILHFHCDIPFWVHSKISKLCLKAMCKDAEKLFVLCHHSQEYLRANYSADSIKVPNFVSPENIVPSHHINDTMKNILYVGGVQPDKGCNELFEAARQCPNKHFILAGKVSDDVQPENLPANVELLGGVPHDEILSLLDQADVFLFPSHSEGFSLALAEAMSRGLPVITTDVGANLDMIEERGGLIVPVGDAKGIINAIRQLEDKQLRTTMSQWNIQKVQECYTTDQVLERMKQHYLEML